MAKQYDSSAQAAGALVTVDLFIGITLARLHLAAQGLPRVVALTSRWAGLHVLVKKLLQSGSCSVLPGGSRLSNADEGSHRLASPASHKQGNRTADRKQPDTAKRAEPLQ